jgi:hypothetical protein
VDQDADNEMGAAYVFQRVGAVWTEMTKLMPSDNLAKGIFGTAVSLRAGAVAIGAPGLTSLQTATPTTDGSVYVYHGAAAVWVEDNKIEMTTPTADAQFGRSVAIDDDYVYIGSAIKTLFGFSRELTGDWTQIQAFTLNEGDAGFTQSVAFQGDLAFTVAPNFDPGRLVAISRPGSPALDYTYVAPTDGIAQTNFRSVDIDGAFTAAGAPLRDAGKGAVYVFVDDRAPTDIALSPSSVAENKPIGTTVGRLSSTDPDGSDTHTYTLVAGTGATDNASFTISGNQLKTAASFNYENKSSYSIRVRTTDQMGLSYEEVLTVTITNVAETNRAPSCSAATVTPSSMVHSASAPFVALAIGNVSDADRDNVTIRVTSIRQDEPTRINSSDPYPDGKGVGTSVPQVRQQAAAGCNGRVYTIAFTATDVNKATCSGSVKVSVKLKSTSPTPFNGGALYDSTR